MVKFVDCQPRLSAVMDQGVAFGCMYRQLVYPHKTYGYPEDDTDNSGGLLAPHNGKGKEERQGLTNRTKPKRHFNP
jgi:hypothetical protein